MASALDLLDHCRAARAARLAHEAARAQADLEQAKMAADRARQRVMDVADDLARCREAMLADAMEAWLLGPALAYEAVLAERLEHQEVDHRRAVDGLRFQQERLVTCRGALRRARVRQETLAIVRRRFVASIRAHQVRQDETEVIGSRALGERPA